MPSLPPTVVKEMFLRLGFSQAVVLKLVDDPGIDSPQTLASFFDEDIIAICVMIYRPGGLVSEKTPDTGNQISVLAMRNLKLAAFMLNTMEHCSNGYRIQDINSTSVLYYQYQWELEQEKSDYIKVLKVD